MKIIASIQIEELYLNMNLHFKKIALLLGSALLLTACQPNGPSIESLQQLRDVDSGIEITNSRIISVSSVNESLSLYDIEGMFKYRDGRYGYLTNLGGIKIYTPFNGEEANPFNATVIASNEDGHWNIVSEKLPQFKLGTDQDHDVLAHKALFANSEEEMPGVFTHTDGTRFMLDNKALDKNVKSMIKEYETLLKKNVALDETLSEMDLVLKTTYESIEKSIHKSLKKEQLDPAVSAEKSQALLATALADDKEYQRILAAQKPLQAEVKVLHSKMPALWSVPQCYETNYRFYGRICNQITNVNRDYLHKISYANRPDADPKFIGN